MTNEEKTKRFEIRAHNIDRQNTIVEADFFNVDDRGNLFFIRGDDKVYMAAAGQWLDVEEIDPA